MLGLPIRWLAETTLAAPAASETFTLADYTVPSGSRHLVLLLNCATSDASDQNILIRLNGDDGATYDQQTLTGAGATVTAAAALSQTSAVMGRVPGTNVHASAMGGGYLLIPHYANALNHKALLGLSGAAEALVMAATARWKNTAAITSVSVSLAAGNLTAASYLAIGVVDERYAIGETLLSGADATVTFSTLPTLQGDLVAVGYLRTAGGGTADSLVLTINSDTTEAHYSFQLLEALGAGTSVTLGASRYAVPCIGDAGAANAFGPAVVHLGQPNRGANDAPWLALGGYNTPARGEVAICTGRRDDVAAITSLLFAGGGGANLLDGSLISLYYVPKRLLYRILLSAPAGTITTPTIPSGYGAIELHVYGRTDQAAVIDNLQIRFNADSTAANYDKQQLRGLSAAVLARQSAVDDDLFDIIAGDTAGANVLGGGVVSIPQYAATDRHKHRLAIGGSPTDVVTISSGRWESVAAITQLELAPGGGSNFLAGTVVELWGVVDTDNEPDEQGTRATKPVVTP